MTELLKKIDGTDLYLYEDDIKVYTQEEVDEINEKERLVNEEALKEVIADGFIPFPVFFENHEGELLTSYFYLPPTFEPSNKEGFFEKYKMKFNIYIPSYGRAENCPTAQMMKRYHVENYYLAIDPSQYSTYKKFHDKKHIIIRDISFRDCSKIDLLTSIKSPNSFHGTSGIYNSLLYFSKSIGETNYWTLDDDIFSVSLKGYRGNKKKYNKKNGFNTEKWTEDIKYNKDDFYRCSRIEEEYGFSYQKFMNSMEEIMLKTRNPGFIGIEKFGLVFNLPVCFRQGTRLYSYYLTNNATQGDHYGQHNNDVIASLELSRMGKVNLILETLTYDSGDTQTGGGLTEVYRKFGTLDKGKVLVKAFPDVSKINFNFNRIHHNVNYQKYQGQRILGNIIEED